jgi:hypothetical protein
MRSVTRLTSCKQVFKVYDVITVPLLYILEVVCCTEKYKKHSSKIYTFVTITNTKKMDAQVKFCNMDLFRKSVVKMGIRLYNKVPDHIKKLDKIVYFKKKRSSFLSQRAFCSVVVFVLYLLHVECMSMWVWYVLISTGIITLHHILL